MILHNYLTRRRFVQTRRDNGRVRRFRLLRAGSAGAYPLDGLRRGAGHGRAGDFVSSQLVVEKITASFDDSTLADFLGGQNSYGAFAAAAPSVNGALLTGSDDAIQRALNDPLAAYLNGTTTEAEMWQAWLDAVANEFPDLIIPEPPLTQ